MSYSETEAREAGVIVFRARDARQAWCLCPDCTTRHARRNKRRTRHDRWAIDGQDWRIHADLRRSAMP